MEETKIIDVAQLLKSEYLEGVFWQWQLGPNPDPWAERDPAKRIWQDYTDDDCRIIEEAFMLNKEVADLKDYEVDIKKMLQVNKKFRNRIRRVRRQEKSRFMMEISEPIAVARDQKTLNDAFGTVQHFLDYIMKRTREAYGLYQRLKTLTLAAKTLEFQDIMNEVIASIERGAEVREKIVKTRSGSQKNFISEAEEIIKLITNNSTTLGDFLKAILKVYTMETFICYWLNELLRSENWEEINVLTPYLVCLVYTFKLSEYVVKYKKSQALMKILGFGGRQKLYLYRGAALPKEHLDLYKSEKVKYFSWNGVTSTSRKKTVALNFIKLSLQKAKKLDELKEGILFKIETDFASPEDCEGMIDVSGNSKFPEEQEIILAPGTVFQLLKVKAIEKDMYEISLKVTKKFGDTKDEIALLGTLQDKGISEDRAIIQGLPSLQSFKLLEMLKGNKLIRKLEIRNSKIEDYIMKEIDDLRATTNVKREDLKLIDNIIVIESLSIYLSSLESMNDAIIQNEIRFTKDTLKQDSKEKDKKIETLVLSEKALLRLKINDRLKELYEKIKNSSQIKTLSLSIREVEMDLLECLKESNSLQVVKLEIHEENSISKEDLERVCQSIGSSNTIKQVYLRFTLLHQGFEFPKRAFALMSSVQNLSLDLKLLSGSIGNRLDHRNNDLKSLTSLQHLSLDFRWWNDISDEGLNHLKKNISNRLDHRSNDLIPITFLQHLSLDFRWSTDISDEGLDHLKSGLIPLTSLQHLSLDFQECNKISDKGLDHLKDGLIPLTSLRHLFLDFQKCDKISDEGLDYLKSGLIPLTSLQHLSLDFWRCNKISDEGLDHLKDGLIPLTSLRHLSLDFQECNKISDEGLDHLKSGLIPLTFLQHLSLNFRWCTNISDEGLDHLKSGLIPLTSLQHLSLDFWRCNKISDESLNHLKSGLISLTSLRHLSLDFQGCNKISDEGLDHLKDGLIPLTSLQHLSLGFRECYKISRKECERLKGELKFIPQISFNKFD